MKHNFDDMEEYAPPPKAEAKLVKPKEIGKADKGEKAASQAPPMPSLEELAGPQPKAPPSDFKVGLADALRRSEFFAKPRTKPNAGYNNFHTAKDLLMMSFDDEQPEPPPAPTEAPVHKANSKMRPTIGGNGKQRKIVSHAWASSMRGNVPSGGQGAVALPARLMPPVPPAASPPRRVAPQAQFPPYASPEDPYNYNYGLAVKDSMPAFYQEPAPGFDSQPPAPQQQVLPPEGAG